MKSIYHGGEKLGDNVKEPLFLYQEISDSIYFGIGYSGVDDVYISEFKLNKQAKVLDLVNGNIEENERFIKEIMKKCGLEFDEHTLVKNSYEDVGRDIYGCDIDLALYPKFREELLKAGFNVIKNYSIIENTEPVGYAILDKNALEFKREYSVKNDDNNVYLEVKKEENVLEKDNILGKSFVGKLGFGDIVLQEITANVTKKKKM